MFPDPQEKMKMKREEYSIELRKQNREQELRKKRKIVQHQNIYQFDDFTMAIPSYLDKQLQTQQRFVLIASGIQLTNNNDEPWIDRIINIFLGNDALLEQLKEDYWNENLPNEFRKCVLQIIVRLTISPQKNSSSLSAHNYDEMLITSMRFSYFGKYFIFLDFSLQGVSNLIALSTDIRKNYLKQGLIKNCSQIMGDLDGFTLNQQTIIYKRIILIFNNLSRDLLEIEFMNQLVNTISLFYEFGYEHLKKDSEYQSDLIYTTYQLTVIQQSTGTGTQGKNDYISSIMESPAFVIVLNQSLRNHNYSVLLPSLKLLSYLFKFKHYSMQVFTKFHEEIDENFGQACNFELNLIRVEFLKLIESLFLTCNNIMVTKLADNNFDMIMKLSTNHTKVRNFCLRVLISLIQSQETIFTQDRLKEILFFIESVYRQTIRQTEILLLALQLSILIVAKEFPHINKMIKHSSIIQLIEQLQTHNNSEVFEQSQIFLNYFKDLHETELN